MSRKMISMVEYKCDSCGAHLEPFTEKAGMALFHKGIEAHLCLTCWESFTSIWSLLVVYFNIPLHHSNISTMLGDQEEEK